MSRRFEPPAKRRPSFGGGRVDTIVPAPRPYERHPNAWLLAERARIARPPDEREIRLPFVTPEDR